ncbi:MAG TPA: thrombospondin type 3 repeat-containing protein [Candidatus Eisenbacteria bacterium]|nr:thrombospondin type 3 repeat-containing protein [Candidatus Eisenbacteria bacterium]
MASPLSRALRVPALVILALSMTAPRAYAIEERAWVSLGPGAAMYDAEQGLKDNFGFGGRAAFFLNRWVGLEGVGFYSKPKLDKPAVGDATFTHFGGGLILTPDRYRWTLPYIYGGFGSAKLDLGSSAKTNSAYHVGMGIVARVGERLGFRVDGRDISYKQTGGAGRDTRVNDFIVSGSVAAFWAGRARDTDEDGVPDKRDKSPNTPHGAVVDATGTPLDTDKDGVYDGLDKQPATTLGAKVDANGVAIDSDGDGVPDGIDQCDSTKTGVVVDAKGCGVDSDGDKVFDGLDKCPNTPAGAVVDASGCPLDADGDGIPDGIDTCPYTPAGTAVNACGCPIVHSPYERALLEEWMIRLSAIEFPPDSAVLQPQAIARLDSVGTVLAQWPMVKVEIGLHVDDQPEPGFRIPLSQMRARAALQYVFKAFPMLNSKNFWITGYGDTDPLVPNTSTANRRINSRIEFRVMNMNVLYQEKVRRESCGTTAAPPAPGLEPKAPPPSDGQAPTPPPENQTAPAPEGKAAPPAPEGKSPPPPEGQAPGAPAEKK